MSGTPGLFAVGFGGEPVESRIELLKGIFRMNLIFNPLAYPFAEFGFNFFSDNKYHLAESGANGIINGVFEDSFAARAHAVHLFEASVPGAHARSKY
ncbi:MAG: hypothetical protein ACKO4W_06035 [Bacteroidota bacterium]